MLDYPVTLTADDNGTIEVSFVDWPAHTFGQDQPDALRHAVDALTTIVDAYIKDGRDIPRPSTGRVRVAVPALMEAKIRLYETMRAAGLNKAELGRRLAWHPPQIDRLLEMRHGSQMEKLEAAFGALGKRLVVDVKEVPRRRNVAAKMATIAKVFKAKPGPGRGATVTVTESGYVARGGARGATAAKPSRPARPGASGREARRPPAKK